jgi:ketosteroid isomerase-like protein
MVAAMSGGAELIRRTLEAFNRRDLEGMLALQHAEAEVVPITAAMEGRVYRGREDMREFLQSIELDWDVFETCPEDYYERGDRALALGTWTARGRGSGVEMTSQRGAWLAQLKDGLVYRWRTYTDRQEALEAFGVPEAELPRYRV